MRGWVLSLPLALIVAGFSSAQAQSDLDNAAFIERIHQGVEEAVSKFAPKNLTPEQAAKMSYLAALREYQVQENILREAVKKNTTEMKLEELRWVGRMRANWNQALAASNLDGVDVPDLPTSNEPLREAALAAFNFKLTQALIYPNTLLTELLSQLSENLTLSRETTQVLLFHNERMAFEARRQLLVLELLAEIDTPESWKAVTKALGKTLLFFPDGKPLSEKAEKLLMAGFSDSKKKGMELAIAELEYRVDHGDPKEFNYLRSKEALARANKLLPEVEAIAHQMMKTRFHSFLDVGVDRGLIVQTPPEHTETSRVHFFAIRLPGVDAVTAGFWVEEATPRRLFEVVRLAQKFDIDLTHHYASNTLLDNPRASILWDPIERFSGEKGGGGYTDCRAWLEWNLQPVSLLGSETPKEASDANLFEQSAVKVGESVAMRAGRLRSQQDLVSEREALGRLPAARRTAMSALYALRLRLADALEMVKEAVKR
jgi:hypothetical protein